MHAVSEFLPDLQLLQAGHSVQAHACLSQVFERSLHHVWYIIVRLTVPAGVLPLPWQDALQPVNSVALGAFGQLRQLVNQQPDIQFPIRGRQAQTWLLNTYLDEVGCSG